MRPSEPASEQGEGLGMPSVPSSPRTPHRRRKSSSVDLSVTSPSIRSNGQSSRRSSYTRKASQSSIQSPLTPWPQSSFEASEELLEPHSIAANRAIESEKDGGLGNLADELAEVEDEDEFGGSGEALASQLEQARSNDHLMANGVSRSEQIGNHDEAPMEVPEDKAALSASRSPPKQSHRSRHTYKRSQSDGFEYDDDSDVEGVDGFSTSLGSRMAAIESLAREGMDVNGDNTSDMVHNFTRSLKDLPSQTGIENNTTRYAFQTHARHVFFFHIPLTVRPPRLMTSHSAITTHMTHQTRTLLTLTHPLVSPLSLPPDPAIIDDLLPFLSDTLACLPYPNTRCPSSLRAFSTTTAELQATLTALSDTVYMNRQTAMQASRKLKSAADLVGELRREADAREEGVRWIEKGEWDERLARRDCARVCGEVVGGFEAVCDGWRAQLTTQGGGAALEVGVA